MALSFTVKSLLVLMLKQILILSGFGDLETQVVMQENLSLGFGPG